GNREAEPTIVFYSHRLVLRSNRTRIGSVASAKNSRRTVALMLRSVAAGHERSRFHKPDPLRCVSKHEGTAPWPSSSFETRTREFDFAEALAHARSSG